MTTLLKERIKILRNEGNSYFKIAAALGLSENTVKSHCRRNKIDAVNSIANIIKTYDGLCGNCNKPVFYTAGAKKKRFCSDTNASLLIGQGVDVATVSKRLGHADRQVGYATNIHSYP